MGGGGEGDGETTEEEIEVALHTLREGVCGVPNVSEEDRSRRNGRARRVNVMVARCASSDRAPSPSSENPPRAATRAHALAHDHFLGITVTAIMDALDDGLQKKLIRSTRWMRLDTSDGSQYACTCARVL